MGMRMDALVRVWALLWAYVVGAIIVSIAGIIGLVFMVIDVIWQLILGTEGLSASGTIGSWINGTFMWTAGQTNYALTGSGSFQWFPSPA